MLYKIEKNDLNNILWTGVKIIYKRQNIVSQVYTRS